MNGLPRHTKNSAEDSSLSAVIAYRTVLKEETPNTVAGRRRLGREQKHLSIYCLKSLLLRSGASQTDLEGKQLYDGRVGAYRQMMIDNRIWVTLTLFFNLKQFINMEAFKTINETNYETFKNYRYGGGSELKIGDKIISGFIVMYANLYGIPPTELQAHDVGLSLQMFVLNEKDGLVYQLYKVKL